MSKTIAIFCAGQAGDCLTISSVLRYRKELWGDAKIVWYISDENRDLLKHQDVELRTFPRGFGYQEMVVEENRKLVEQGKEPIWENWQPLVDQWNHMNLELKKYFPSLSDIDYGYFPAPHQVPVDKRHNVDYPNVSRKVFGIPDEYEWHPVLEFSEQECEAADEFVSKMVGTKIVFFETFAGSGQSLLDEIMVTRAINTCMEHWGANCSFIFGSHKFLRDNEKFPEWASVLPGAYSCKEFTVRQCALIAEKADLIISVSSGITVAASCWGNNPIPILQFCGSDICGTKTLALGQIEQVFADNKTVETAKKEFYLKLIQLLSQ